MKQQELEKRIEEMEQRALKAERQRDHYKDVLKGMARNINDMLRPIGGHEG